MPNLAELIRDKQRRLQELESEAGKIRSELLAAKQTLLEPAHLDPSPLPARKGGNSTEWAESVLRKKGEPMHVNEIISAIEREFQVSVKYATLVGNISRLVKRGRIFERVGPNQFSLLEWAVAREASEMFGREDFEREHDLDAH